VDLHTVKTRIDSVSRRVSIFINRTLDLRLRHLHRYRHSSSLEWHGRRTHQFRPHALQRCNMPGPPLSPQLAPDPTPFRVDRTGDFSPRGDLGLGPDARDVEAAGVAFGDDGCFAYYERAGLAGALSVVLCDGVSREYEADDERKGGWHL